MELELDGLRRRYGSVTALDGLSFAVPAGQVFGFPGPNGAGKTTAMRAIFGFLPPTAPIAMPVLYAAGDVPVWQVAVSAVLCAASTVWLARVAARIYSRSILRTGDRIRLSQVLRRETETA